MSDPGPSLLSPDQARALGCVLDEIIPESADGGLPGARELGLVDNIEQALERMPDLKTAIDAGLSALQDLVRERGAEDYAALPQPQRREILDQLAAAQPAFLPGLIFHTYVAYYQHPRVLEALGLEARPPFPKGYEMQPGDFGGLEAVRRRGRIFREC